MQQRPARTTASEQRSAARTSARPPVVSLSRWIAGVLLVVATLWTFAPILDNAFVWDDGANLVAARTHWGTGLGGIVWALTQPYAGHYQPLTWFSYRLDLWLWSASAAGVHATNLVLHVIVTGLVGALAWVLTGPLGLDRKSVDQDPRDERFRWGASFSCAAIFAVHPIHVETVAWATERRDLLSTALTLAAVLRYLHVRLPNAESPRGMVGVSVLHACAALARAQMSLPFVLLALDIGVLNRLGREGDRGRSLARLVKEKWASFGIAAVSAALALWAQRASGALTAATEHGVWDRLVQTGYSLAFYPQALVYRPYWLPLYERPYPFDPFDPTYLLPAGLGFLGVALAFAGVVKRRPSLAASAVLAYVALVLPVSGIAQSGVQLVADRYAYLSTIPLILTAGLGLSRLIEAAPRPWVRGVAWTVILTVLIAGAGTARRQTLVWKNDETLWRHVLLHSGSCLADNNLGQILFVRGESGAALFHLTRALERVPTYPRPWRAIVALLDAPWPSDAPPAGWVAQTIDRAAAASGGGPERAYASGLAWIHAGESGRALVQLRQVLAKDPAHEGARLAIARLNAAAAKEPPRAPASAR